ncbi:MAG: hypothetical protein KA976_04700 [Paludibacteraceae bacterium]|nr:hypothetical protein [Paludibacteraceae bacterium]
METKNKSLIDQFVDLSMEAFENHDDEFFEIMGIDKKTFLSDGLHHIKQIKLKSTATLKKNKNEKLINTAASQIQQILNSGDERKILKLGQIFGTNNMQTAFYHNLEKLNEQELKDLLQDKNLLNIIENLDEIKDEK